MQVYKIFRADEWQALQHAGQTAGAPIDLADGYVHLSTGAQVAETLRLHFAGAEGLQLLALEGDSLGDDLRWETSRGGSDFPHLYRHLNIDDVLWGATLVLEGGLHVLPEGVQ
jgi:uncharacterized protein (DUF952 family)